MLHINIKLTNSSQIHGNGLIATSVIREGEIVWQLDLGEQTFSLKETEEWTEGKKRDFDQFGFQCGEDKYVLPTGLDKFMNHSCDPNTWWKNSSTLVARRDIHLGEEITYDYSTADISREYEFECHCGARDCRKVVTNKDYQNQDWQQKYGTNLPDHIMRAINKLNR